MNKVYIGNIPDHAKNTVNLFLNNSGIPHQVESLTPDNRHLVMQIDILSKDTKGVILDKETASIYTDLTDKKIHYYKDIDNLVKYLVFLIENMKSDSYGV